MFVTFTCNILHVKCNVLLIHTQLDFFFVNICLEIHMNYYTALVLVLSPFHYTAAFLQLKPLHYFLKIIHH